MNGAGPNARNTHGLKDWNINVNGGCVTRKKSRLTHVGIANCTVKKYARGDDYIKSIRSIALPRSEAARASEY